jgi:hydrogenase maturation protease
MLEYITGYREVVFIDAMKTGESKVGEISYFLPAHFRETLHLSNVHDLDFCTTLALGRKLDYAIPRDILVIAVEIREDREFGRGYSPEIKRLFPHICRQISSFLFPVLQGEMTLAGRIMTLQDLSA